MSAGVGQDEKRPGWHSSALPGGDAILGSEPDYFFFAAGFFADFLLADLAAGFFLLGTDVHLRSMFGVCCSHHILNR
jgi:hypothetical protein